MHIALKQRVLFLSLALLAISSCTVRLIAPYDAITDQKVSELHESINLTFKKWQREVPPYDSAVDFYDEAEVRLDILIQRNEAIEKSELIVNMLKKVNENIGLLRELHKASTDGFDAVLEQTTPDLNAQFNAIQKFQMALKRASEN